MQVSPNFAFLERHDLRLVRLGSLAERYFADDPNTCLLKLRQFGEILAQLVAAKVGFYNSEEENQAFLLRRLQREGAIAGQICDLFHVLRREGNAANHQLAGEHRAALSNLKHARSLGVWFHRSYGGVPDFKPGPFLPPADPAQETEALREELARLRAEREEQLAALTELQSVAQEEAELRRIAELFLEDAEAEAKAADAKLAALQATAIAQSPQERQASVAQAREVAQQLNLDERETRRLIDAQLRAAGWEVDSEELRYGNGTRPQKGRNLAIAEWPTKSGPADYVLFVGLEALATVEAKRQRKDVSAAIDQAKRYSRDFRFEGGATAVGGPWGDYKIPFVFATNGRPYLEQLRTKSGIWFCDLRRPQNLRDAHPAWYGPRDLLDKLAQDVAAAQQRLQDEPFAYDFPLRDYQERAIRAVESALATGQRNLLLAMATGTGKTKTSIALVYRLLKAKRFQRILFLVDRSALGDQAADAFKETRIESLQTFADIFEIKELGDKEPDRETKVQIATVQSMVKRLLYPEDGPSTFTAGQYDCIVVDECHRGYLLDREMGEAELTFRDLNDYISAYRRVIEYFDAVRIGLTATPALHTTEIFGEPVFQYGYREAVIDGWLIDHEPPIQIKTELSEEGIAWNPGEQVELFDPKTGETDLVHAPDEIRMEVGQFNRKVITEEFNRVVCEELARQIDPDLPGKTLIFCVNNDHADLVVDCLKRAFQEQYGEVDDDDVRKITGTVDKPKQAIRQYRNEVSPKIAVTVDLLTTGIDVPRICNLVFLRRVNSRILYEQMVGRATRQCEDIGKEVFYIYDAVDLYANLAPVSTMKPVAVNPQFSFQQLADELDALTEPEAIAAVLDQYLAKLQRKRRRLGEESRETIEGALGMSLTEAIAHLRSQPPEVAATWLRERRAISELLDRRDGGAEPLLVSRHADTLRRVERGYGTGEPPEDYLEGFGAFLRENINQIPALVVVTQRPRELTRAQLKELQLALDAAGYSQTALRAAWRDATNEDIAATIVGFIRQAALGDALVPYEERVERALKKILKSRTWTPPQRKWLERIGKQLARETVVDREVMNRGQFKAQGGFARIDKIFDGQLAGILTEIQDSLWQTDGETG